MLQKLLAIIRPSEVKGIKGIPLAMEAWEGKIEDFMMEYQVDFPDKFKVAILVGMVCKEMQDEVFRDTADLMKEGAYGQVTENMKRISSNRISQDTPQPMDIGAINDGDADEQWEEQTAACATVYQKCAEELVSNEKVNSELRNMLALGLDRAKKVDSANSRAWMLRRNLDQAMSRIHSSSRR